MAFGTRTSCFPYIVFFSTFKQIYIYFFFFCFTLFQQLHPFYGGYSDATQKFNTVIYCVKDLACVHVAVK